MLCSLLADYDQLLNIAKNVKSSPSQFLISDSVPLSQKPAEAAGPHGPMRRTVCLFTSPLTLVPCAW